jgi:hypothetical protein
MTKRQRFTGETPTGKGKPPDVIGGQMVAFIVDKHKLFPRPLTRLEQFDAQVDAMRHVPTGAKRTCALPGCREHWTQGVQRGRQRMFCCATHRNTMYDRRKALERREARERPTGDLVV